MSQGSFSKKISSCGQIIGLKELLAHDCFLVLPVLSSGSRSQGSAVLRAGVICVAAGSGVGKAASP